MVDGIPRNSTAALPPGAAGDRADTVLMPAPLPLAETICHPRWLRRRAFGNTATRPAGCSSVYAGLIPPGAARRCCHSPAGRRAGDGAHRPTRGRCSTVSTASPRGRMRLSW
jgi:hypothetical protein